MSQCCSRRTAAAATRTAILPAIARRISRKRYRLKENALGCRAATFAFDREDTALAELEFMDGRVEKRPVGLDGLPRQGRAARQLL